MDYKTGRRRFEAVIVLAHSLGLFDVEERIRVTQGIPDLLAEQVTIFEAAIELAEELAEPDGSPERGLNLIRAAARAVETAGAS